MTSSDLPVPERTIRIREPGELVAAIPALLGFRPRESLVLVSTGGRSGHRLGLTLRADLPPPEFARSVATECVRALMRDTPRGAAVIVVSSGSAADGTSGEAPAGRGADPPHVALVGLVTAALQVRGVDVHTVVGVPRIEAAAPWACYPPCDCHGLLPDPASSAFAAAAVAEGRVVRGERVELEQLVAPADPARIRRREERLVRALDSALGGERIGILPIADPVAGIALLDAAITDAAAGRLVLDDERVLVLATALGLPEVRDAAVIRCGAPDPAAAENLWAALTRETPDPEAATPAALLAVSALLRGDGALANVALDRAERAWPGHRLTVAVTSIAQQGMPPAEFRACLRSLSPGNDFSATGPRRVCDE